MPDNTELDIKELRESHKARAEYKAKLVQERIGDYDEELAVLGIHLKNRSRG
jgi:hypothetical protein